MSTKSLLEQSVVIAGESVSPFIGTLQDQTREIRDVDVHLLNSQERSLLAIAEALDGNLPLINIEVAISAGGANPEGFPNLAIARYEMSIGKHPLEVATDRDGFVRYSDPWRSWSLRFPDGTLPARKRNFFSDSGFQEAETAVPLVPLKLRQREPDRIFLLFEAPEWTRVVRPVDPYLLQHIAGLIYAVIGTWDVTEKEINAYQTARKLGLE